MLHAIAIAVGLVFPDGVVAIRRSQGVRAAIKQIRRLSMWDRFLKWAAGHAFQWGLRILTERFGEGKPSRKVVRHRKPYVQ